MAEPEDTPDGLVPAPRTNPDLVGQEDAEAEFLQAYETGKLPHAWIVGGPRGIGKATLAFRIARFVLAAGNNNGPDLFGGAGAAPASLRIESDHPVFRRVLSGGHADLLTVERGVDEQRNRRRDEITVGEARQVSSFLTKTPAEGGWRVVIVDEAEAMNHNSANAILKTLEEPPRQTLLLLVCHNSGRMLPTIRSRCRQLRLRPLADAVLATLLEQYAPAIGAPEQAAAITLARGSIGRALEFADGAGVTLYHELTDLLSVLPGLDMAALHGLSDRIGRDQSGELFRTTRELLGWWMSHTLRAAAIDPSRLPSRTAGPRSLDRWFEVWEKINRLFERAESVNLDRKQVILNAILAIHSAARA